MSDDATGPHQVGDKQLIVVGDRVLIQPDDEHKTRVGLFLPKDAIDKKEVRGGRIIATGPGSPLPSPESDDEEPWKLQKKAGRYLPMQALKGDYALFFRRAAVDVSYQDEDFVIVSESAILLLIREP